MEDPTILQPSQSDLIKPQQVKYEFLDHTADVQIHAWGDSLKEAFEQTAIAMSAYMTDIQTVSIDKVIEVEVQGEDMLSLLYQFLDEVLFLFNAEPNLICSKVDIIEFDQEQFKIKARCCGEIFDLDKHPQGTEIKAITYSNMQIHEKEVYVIIDI